MIFIQINEITARENMGSAASSSSNLSNCSSGSLPEENNFEKNKIKTEGNGRDVHHRNVGTGISRLGRSREGPSYGFENGTKGPIKNLINNSNSVLPVRNDGPPHLERAIEQFNRHCQSIKTLAETDPQQRSIYDNLQMNEIGGGREAGEGGGLVDSENWLHNKAKILEKRHCWGASEGEGKSGTREGARGTYARRGERDATFGRGSSAPSAQRCSEPPLSRIPLPRPKSRTRATGGVGLFGALSALNGHPRHFKGQLVASIDVQRPKTSPDKTERSSQNLQYSRSRSRF